MRSGKVEVGFDVLHENTSEVSLAVDPDMVEAFPFDTAPRFLIQDRDDTYGETFRRRVRSLDIGEVITARRSSWQNPAALIVRTFCTFQFEFSAD